MKKLIFNTLSTDTDLLDLVGDLVGTPPDEEIVGRIYQRYALGQNGIPDQPKMPFLLLSELPAYPARNKPRSSRALTHYIQVYVYDEKGSYARIEQILVIVRELVLALWDQVSPSGSRCLEVNWDTTSQDYDDDNYDAFVKHITFSITGSTVQP